MLSTDYPDSATYTVSGKMQIHDVPAGWSVDCDMRTNGATGQRSAFYILKNGMNTYRWYFDGATDIAHTVDELRGVRLILLTEWNRPDMTPRKMLFIMSMLIAYTASPVGRYLGV